MKRILSVAVIATMILTIMSISAFATADVTFTLSTNKVTANAGETIKLTIDAGEVFIAGWGLEIAYDTDVFSVAKNKKGKDDYSTPNFTGSLEKFDTKLSIGGMSSEGWYITDGDDDLGKTSYINFVIAEDAPSGVYTFTPTVMAKNLKDDELNLLTGEAVGCSITVVGVDPTPAVNTVTATPTLVGSGAAYLGASEGEYGSAFRIQFAKPSVATGELLDDVIFGVTPEGEARRYSPKQTGVLFGLSGDITLDVSFLNGSTAAGSYKKDGEAVSPKTITAVSVIMKDSEGNYYYSDANDANAAE